MHFLSKTMNPKLRFSLLLGAASALPTLSLPALAQTQTAPRPANQAATQPVAAKRPPNVLFIMADDLNMNLGVYGHPMVKTPNIDRLAARGVSFANAYCNYPLCNPSRTSLLSGLRPDTTGVVGNDQNLKGVVWLPEYFGHNNYFTARVGKIEHGADSGGRMINWTSQEKSLRGGNAPLVMEDFWAAQDAGKTPVWIQPRQIVEYRASNRRDEDETDGKTARRIVELMEERLKLNQENPKQAQPFFLAAGLFRPHLPFIAPKKYFDMYPPESIVLPKEYEPVGDRDDIPAIALTGAERNKSDIEKKRTIAAYYACITFMDAQVGVMLDGLDRLGLRDNTVVMLMGDHGFQLDEHAGRGGNEGVWRKSMLFRESTRTPLIVSAPPGVLPGARAGVISNRVVEFVDIFPTLNELAGLSPLPALDGVSFAPLLTNPEQTWKSAVFTQVTRGKIMGRSAQTERYRYSEWGSPDASELYDHQSDPKEYRNLAKDPASSAILSQMRSLLQKGPNAALPPGVAPRPAPQMVGVVDRKGGGGGD